MMAQSPKLFEQMVKEGGKVLGWYWTLGRYDVIIVTESTDEKAAMRSFIRFGDLLSTQTLVAIPREEALKNIKDAIEG
jgi:uncharacterized protein with GYD domain